MSAQAQMPLILKSHRIMDAFAKSNDERDFYLNREEGFLVYVDLDKSQEDLDALEKEIEQNKDKYYLIPKLTFYETKKIMEGFVTEKVYDIDTKEKLLDIIQSKEARENFLEFISDHHTEFEKWQQYYQERSRIRIIEWLRINHFHFVFEEDLEMEGLLIDKLKRTLFDTKVGKDIAAARKNLLTKAKTYYSTEALNPRPKRGRPPKQIAKIEVETQASMDIFLTVTPAIRPFLFIPDLTPSGMTFSAKFDEELDLLTPRRFSSAEDLDDTAASFNQKIAALRSLSSRWVEPKANSFEDNEEFEEEKKPSSKTSKKSSKIPPKANTKTASIAKSVKPGKSKTSTTKSKTTKSAPKSKDTKAAKKPVLRSIVKSKKANAASKK